MEIKIFNEEEMLVRGVVTMEQINYILNYLGKSYKDEYKKAEETK